MQRVPAIGITPSSISSVWSLPAVLLYILHPLMDSGLPKDLPAGWWTWMIRLLPCIVRNLDAFRRQGFA